MNLMNLSESKRQKLTENNVEVFSNDKNYGILLDQKQVNEILYYCKESNNLETGGILIGRYNASLNKAIISKVTEPTEDSKKGRTWLFIGVHGLKELLRNVWFKHSIYYLGEWHFHPNSSPNPSDTDIQQLKKISENNLYRCPEPILLIIGGSVNTGWSCRFFVYPRGKSLIELF